MKGYGLVLIGLLIVALVMVVPSGADVITTTFGTDAIGNSVAIQPDGKIVAAGYADVGGVNNFAVARYNTGGSLDTTFNPAGIIPGTLTTHISIRDAVINSVAIQPDGKIVAAGYADVGGVNNFAVARYNTDGSLDTTFNPADINPGIVTTTIGTNAVINSVAIQPDGKIVAAGYADVDGNFAVARYNTDGSLDTTFNPTGITPGTLTTTIGRSAAINSVAIQPDGKIVAVGWADDSVTFKFAVARYNTGGSLDTTFNPAGITPGTLTTTIGTYAMGKSVAIQPDGKIVAGGEAADGVDKFAVARYNTDGSLDTTFNPTGITPGTLTTTIGTSAAYSNSIIIQPDGKIVVAGFASRPWGVNNFAVARYNTDGSLDTTFNPAGITPGIVTNTIGTDAKGNSVAIQPDGKIVVAGYAVVGGVWNFAVARYNTDGSLDTTFNPIGITPGIVTNTIATDAMGNSVAIQPDGKIVVAGYAVVSGVNNFAVARYNTDGSLDTTFNPTGFTPGTLITTIATDAKGNSVAIQPDGKIVVAGWADDSVTLKFAVARYNTDGSLDTTFNPAGITPGTLTTTIGRSAAINSVAIQPDGKIVAAGSADVGWVNNFAVARYNTDGSLDTTFNPAGITPGTLTTTIGTYAMGNSVAIQPDGKIVAAGEAADGGNKFAVARYNTDGSLDTTFNPAGITPGIVTTTIGTEAKGNSVAIQPDGKIVAAGEAADGGNKFAVARYNTGGSLDPTFNPAGITPGTLTTTIGRSAFINSVAIQPDGKIVAAGGAADGFGPDFAIARYNTGGSLDTTFNPAGITPGTLTTTIGINAFSNSVAIHPEGKIVAAGYADVAGIDNFALARYNTPFALAFTSIAPNSGPISGATSVIITGSRFTGASAVTFDGTAAGSFMVNSDTRITATTPAHAAGAVNVVVTTAGGSATGTNTYTYVTSVIPTLQNPGDSSGSGGDDFPGGSSGNTGTGGQQQTGQNRLAPPDEEGTPVNVGGNTPVSSVVVTGTGIKDTIVTATEVPGPGQNIQSPPGSVYIYLDISPARYGTITGAEITFSVPQSWLAEQQLTPQEIVLYHNVGKDWQALPTTVVKTINGQVYFTATSPGFSRFAIAGKASGSPATAASGHVQTFGDLAPAPVTSAPARLAPPAAGSPVARETSAAPAPVATEPGFPLATIALIGAGCVVLIGSGWYVRRWYIRRQNPALFEEY